MKIIKLFSFLTVFVFWTESSAEPVQNKIDVYFSVFPLDSANWRGIYFSPAGNPLDDRALLFFNPSERSPYLKYSGPPNLHFFRMVQNSEGEKTPMIIATVNLHSLENNSRLILFFDPNDDSDTFQISVMRDTPEHFPDESIVFFNTMNIPFIGILNNTKIHLNPGLSIPISVSDFLNTNVPIVLAIRDNEDIHLVAKNNMRFSENRRTLMLLRPPRREGSLRIRTQRLTEFTGDRSGATVMPHE